MLKSPQNRNKRFFDTCDSKDDNTTQLCTEIELKYKNFFIDPNTNHRFKGTVHRILTGVNTMLK
jgi:hypothetical protein